MTDLTRVSLAIETPLLERLEAMIADSGATNRSEFLRDLIRSRLVETEWETGAEAVGTITLVFDHHARNLNAKLTDLQHDHHGTILAATHVHLDAHTCVEMILAKGPPARIRQISNQLGRQKGVLHAALSMSSTGKELS